VSDLTRRGHRLRIVVSTDRINDGWYDGLPDWCRVLCERWGSAHFGGEYPHHVEVELEVNQ
jgi:hypothetical protein